MYISNSYFIPLKMTFSRTLLYIASFNHASTPPAPKHNNDNSLSQRVLIFLRPYLTSTQIYKTTSITFLCALKCKSPHFYAHKNVNNYTFMRIKM